MLRLRIATAAVLLAILLPSIFIAPPWVWGAVSLEFVAVAMTEWTRALEQPRWVAISAFIVTAIGAVLLAVSMTGATPATGAAIDPMASLFPPSVLVAISAATM